MRSQPVAWSFETLEPRAAELAVRSLGVQARSLSYA
jgi:hypothetical protein